MNPDSHAVLVLADQIKPLLAGKAQEMQGAVLAELLGLWLAGHPDFVREQVLIMHIDYVLKLTVASEGELFGGHGHPQNTGAG